MRCFLVAVSALSACSFGMKSVDPKWDGTSEPECSDSAAPVVIDALAAGVLLGIGAIAGDKSTAANNVGMSDSGDDTLALVGLGGGLVYAISAAIGEHSYKQCDDAYTAWRIGGAIHGGADEHARQRATEGAPRSLMTGKPIETPRGFFCAASHDLPAASSCSRDKTDCQRTRGAAIVGVPDLGDCALQESAWCVDDACLPSRIDCDARRDRMGSDAAACVEER